MATVLYQQDELFEGFTIRFEALPELESLQSILQGMCDEDRTEAEDDIRRGGAQLFIAKVTARRAGIELAETYLGGCIYEAYLDFINGGGYYSEMRKDVIQDAKRKLTVLRVPDSRTA